MYRCSCHSVNGPGILGIQVQSNKIGVIGILCEHSLSANHGQICTATEALICPVKGRNEKYYNTLYSTHTHIHCTRLYHSNEYAEHYIYMYSTSLCIY